MKKIDWQVVFDALLILMAAGCALTGALALVDGDTAAGLTWVAFMVGLLVLLWDRVWS